MGGLRRGEPRIEPQWVAIDDRPAFLWPGLSEAFMGLESGTAGLKTQVPQSGCWVEEDTPVEANSAVARGQGPV